MTGISTTYFALRLFLAILMGASVGLERQWRQRMTGTRTNALVAAGAGAFVMCGLLFDIDPLARGAHRLVRRLRRRISWRGRCLQRRSECPRTQHRGNNLVFGGYRCAVWSGSYSSCLRSCGCCPSHEHGASPVGLPSSSGSPGSYAG